MLVQRFEQVINITSFMLRVAIQVIRIIYQIPKFNTVLAYFMKQSTPCSIMHTQSSVRCNIRIIKCTRQHFMHDYVQQLQLLNDYKLIIRSCVSAFVCVCEKENK